MIDGRPAATSAMGDTSSRSAGSSIADASKRVFASVRGGTWQASASDDPRERGGLACRRLLLPDEAEAQRPFPRVPAVAVDQDRSPALAEIVGAGRVRRVVRFPPARSRRQRRSPPRGAERGGGERAPIAVCPRPADVTPPSSCTAEGSVTARRAESAGACRRDRRRPRPEAGRRERAAHGSTSTSVCRTPRYARNTPRHGRRAATRRRRLQALR